MDSTPKKSSEVLLSFHNDKEVSIRELQFQEKLEELRLFKNWDEQTLEEIMNKKKGVHYQEVLVNETREKIYRSLSKFNKRENLSVERIARTFSPFKPRTSWKPPLPNKYKSKKKDRKVRPKSVFNFGNNWVYLTEKEENFKWNDITNKQLAEKVRMSIQEVDQVLKINEYPSWIRSLSTNNWRTEATKNIFITEEEVCKTPSPRASYHKFRELLKSNKLVTDSEKVNTPKIKDQENLPEPLTGSKLSYKTNWETDVREEIFRPKQAMSPNLRYKETETQNEGSSSGDNKIVITDELKLSNFGSTNDEKGFSQKESYHSSSKVGSNKEDSIWEYKETDVFPLMKSPPSKTDNILFSVKVPKNQQNDEKEEKLIEEEKLFVHPKLEIIASQLPLHSISEDANSPYFASSPSNITAYVWRQSTPNKAKSNNIFEPKFSSTTDNNDDAVSADKNFGCGGTFQTTTSVSDNFLENANIDSLESKLDKIMKKRSKRIEIFETYLNEWEKQKYNRGGDEPKVKKMTKAKTEKKSVKKNKTPRVRNNGKRPVKSVRNENKRIKPSLYLTKSPQNSGIGSILNPVLSSGNKSHRLR